MASTAELQRQRKKVLAAAKKVVKEQLDAPLEKLQRRLNSLRSKKKLILREDAITLEPIWNNVKSGFNNAEYALADFISTCFE